MTQRSLQRPKAYVCEWEVLSQSLDTQTREQEGEATGKNHSAMETVISATVENRFYLDFYIILFTYINKTLLSKKTVYFSRRHTYA